MPDRIARRLRVQDNEAVLLANGLELILGEAPEILIIERLPELRDEEREAPTVHQLLGQMKEVHGDGGANQRPVQELGDIKAGRQRVSQGFDEGVLLIVEDPGIGTVRLIAAAGVAPLR